LSLVLMSPLNREAKGHLDRLNDVENLPDVLSLMAAPGAACGDPEPNFGVQHGSACLLLVQSGASQPPLSSA
jgi:hypothetical protein